MSDEEMVAHLARCQLDPAMPRCSIETLLHAFVPAAARRPHPPRRDQRDLPAPPTASGSRASASATRRRGSRTSARASRSPSRSALAARASPGVRFVLLAKHGLVTWGETARGVLRGRRSRRSTARRELVCARASGPRFGGPAREPLSEPDRTALLAALLPALRGAVSSERAKLLQRRRLPDGAGARLLARRARAHPGRRRLPGPPRAHEARAAVGRRTTPPPTMSARSRRASPSAPSATATTTAPTSRRTPPRATRSATPTRASC